MTNHDSRGWLDVPDWLADLRGDPMPSVVERMQFVIDLAGRNVDERTGGPFAAAIFEVKSGQLVSCGVNRVVATHCSHAHAEMIAIARAQQRFKTHDLGLADLPALQLISSCEPCAMCLGAICWSGLRSVVCAARDFDVHVIGFDEGPKPLNWIDELERRGIVVETDVMRAEARKVIQRYADNAGEIYSPTRS